ncbi:MAG: hypothetical protein HPY85_07040 [Anaerolineae bacterium]|nr:hypothetical protein [Anaerolineae bacterium]
MTVETAGFLISEFAGIGAGVHTFETGPGAIAAKLLADVVAGVIWNGFSDAVDIRRRAVNFFGV